MKLILNIKCIRYVKIKIVVIPNSQTIIICVIRGRGLFLGIDLVRDRNTREPATQEAQTVVRRSVFTIILDSL